MLGFNDRPSSSCKICTQSYGPEALYPLEIPFFQQRHQVCATCRADFETSGRALSELQAPEPPPRPFPWPGPVAADLESSSDGLREALRAQLEVRAARPDPSPEGTLDPEQLRSLIKAWEAWDGALPYYDSKSAQDALGFVLFSVLTLELGGRAPKLYGRQGGPEEWLKALSDQARSRPALRDPRLPWLRAVLALEAGNLAGVDRELSLAQEWLAGQQDPERWTAVSAGIHYARALRARARSLWGAERDALKDYCRAAPEDELGFFELARAQIRCARPEVAREILAARLGSAKATPEAVAREVERELSELRPRLGQLHAGAPEAPSPALAYAACLLALDEHDEAWRVLSGSEWLDQVQPSEWTPAEEEEAAPPTSDLDPATRPYLELAARAAHGRGRLDQALTLLRAAHDLASRSGADEPRARRDLLAVLQEELCERLDELEARTRESARERAELAASLSRLEGESLREAEEELASLETELSATLRGEGGDFEAGGGLSAIHDILRQHGAALSAELREPIARRALDWFLGREFAARFTPLVEPPSPLDSGRVRLADDRYRTHLAYRALARRQLPDALAHDHRARDAVGFGAPIRPLLTYLELVRRGGPALQGWATLTWLESLRGSGRGQLPFEVGLLPVLEEELESLDLRRFELLLRVEDPERPPEWPSLASLRGRCRILFPSEGDPSGLPKVPRVRAYLQRLLETLPGLALLLDWGSETFRLVLGCLASPDALTLEGLNAGDESVLASVESLLARTRSAAAELGLDPQETAAALLENLPPELRARFE